MICVACNDPESFESVDKWRNEIHLIEQQKPILLVLTKSDLIESLDEPVTLEDLADKSKTDNFQGEMATSSKEWHDFNVHKAFNKVLQAAYLMKYGDPS